MKMTSLEQLHQSMRRINCEIQQFQLSSGGVSFDCLFSTRDRPNYTLSLTSRGSNPKFFIFQVERGYWIKPYFAGFYSELAEVLNTGANSGNTLAPKEFLEGINRKIPIQASITRNPSTAEIIRLRPDITEDRDRPYFDTWISWSNESGRGPSPENQQKTRVVLGLNALEHSLRNNASSKWSTVDLGRTWDN
ncbi:DUF6037 family protein [Geomonas limicola]|uniref:DUF6037 family protein n=1 Tax=Geomonas limicola TaxID=2740186 RepID=UPI001621DFE3|nr:DUF6037 family protein [Geomonas limicola]